MDKKEREEIEFYSYLSKEEKELLDRNIKKKQFKKGELIYSPAKDCLGMLWIKKGIVRIYLFSEEGKKATIFRLREKEVCVLAMSCILHNITFEVEIEAEEDGEFMVLPVNILEKLKEKNIYVENFIYKMTIQKFSFVIEAVQQILFMSLEQRVIHFLLEEVTIRKTDFLQITKEELAENIGSAREAVSRVLTKLAKEDYILVSRGKIEVLEKEKLHRKIET